MSGLKTDLFRKLLNRRGESLVEGMVSILIFSIIMTAVTAIIFTSLRVTEIYTNAAKESQESANMSILEKSEVEPGYYVLEITGGGINVGIEVKLSKQDGFTAFYPEEIH